MKKKMKKKLQLNRETVRHLSHDDLGEVAGGTTNDGSCPTAPRSICLGTCPIGSCGPWPTICDC